MAPPTKSASNEVSLKFEAKRLRAHAQGQFRELESLRRRLLALSDQQDERQTVNLRPVGLARKRAAPVVAAQPEESTPWWPTVVYPAAPLVPPPGLAAMSLRDRNPPVLGFIVLGMDNESLDRMVGLVNDAQVATMSFIPVFFTDSADFSFFRRFNYLLEYIPPAARSSAASRIEYLRKKWGVHSVIDLRDPSEVDFAIPTDEQETMLSAEPDDDEALPVMGEVPEADGDEMLPDQTEEPGP